MTQWATADPDVVRVLRDSPSQPQKLVVDSRYLWPTVVFEQVCHCNGNFGGVDCNECAYGWNPETNCETRKDYVIRKSFIRLSPKEKEDFVDATLDLKSEICLWMNIMAHPPILLVLQSMSLGGSTQIFGTQYVTLNIG